MMTKLALITILFVACSGPDPKVARSKPVPTETPPVHICRFLLVGKAAIEKGSEAMRIANASASSKTHLDSDERRKISDAEDSMAHYANRLDQKAAHDLEEAAVLHRLARSLRRFASSLETSVRNETKVTYKGAARTNEFFRNALANKHCIEQ
jgi:hypothetical protein